MNEPQIEVGILSDPQITCNLLAPYLVNGEVVTGKQVLYHENGRISWNGAHFSELLFTPVDAANASFELCDVTIGINFHWERKENQRFPGQLKLIVEQKNLIGINVVGVEEYLTSVISSEMSAQASRELLRAHAVISRSWLLDKLKKRGALPNNQQVAPSTLQAGDSELIRWYECDAHTHFDVCADDHCQRYQGITRATTPLAAEATASTRGEVLMSNGEVCDARFSKCCGGAFEEFASCWENRSYSYLQRQRDSKTASLLPDLRIEGEADRWIRSAPEAFCNTTDKRVLEQVLNNYDQETTDFYRWQVRYDQETLAKLIFERSGIDFGEILDLIPVERGPSGRLIRLKIVGNKRTLTIGKELEIRRTLSPSHLYSSAFVIDKQQASSSGVPTQFILTGAGWGHGVGLCQIGAAVMGEQGFGYDEILLHYYAGATIEQLY